MLKKIKLISGQKTVLSALMITIMALVAALSGAAEQQTALANSPDNTAGVAGLHACGYAILDDDMQVQTHVVQIRWGAASSDIYEDVHVKLTASATGLTHIGAHHVGSKDGGVHQFPRIAQNHWPELVAGGDLDYWIYFVWTIPMDTDTDPPGEGDNEYVAVAVSEDGKRNCSRAFGFTAEPPVTVPGAPTADAYSPPGTPSSTPSQPPSFGIELIDSGANDGNIKLTWNTHPYSERVDLYRIWRRVSNNPYFVPLGDYPSHDQPTHDGDDHHAHDMPTGISHQPPVNHQHHAHRHIHTVDFCDTFENANCTDETTLNHSHAHNHSHSHPHEIEYTDADTAKLSATYEYRVEAWNEAGWGTDTAVRSVRKKDVNHRTTGTPAMSGIAIAGETLRAGPGYLADRNGTTNAVITYQWRRNRPGQGTTVVAGNVDTYTLTDADANHYIRVRGAFTQDDDGYPGDARDSRQMYVEFDDPLTLLVDKPASHDGNSFNFYVLFTEEPVMDAQRFRRMLNVTGGSISNIRKVWAEEWAATATPYSQADMSITIDETPPFGCGANDAVCSAVTTGKRLAFVFNGTVAYQASSNQREQQEESEQQDQVAATGKPSITGTPSVGQTLAVDTSGVSDENGMTNTSFSYSWNRTAGGTTTQVGTASSYVVTTDDQGKAISVRVSFTDDEGNAESVTSSSVNVPKPPLTASISSTVTSHDGNNAFVVRVSFSEQFPLSYKTVRDHLLDVTNGTVQKAKRTNPSSSENNRMWTITVTPSSSADVTARLKPTTDCSDTGSICTADDRPLTSNGAVTVRGP